MANLTNFVIVPASATVGGAPIDAFQGAAFRQNDTTLDLALSQLAQAPFLRNDGFTGGTVNVSLANIGTIILGTTVNISAGVVATAGVPVIIMATQSIALNAVINASGKSLPASSTLTEGNIGGSGGGGSTPGGDIVMPISKAILAPGGPNAASSGQPGVADFMLRMLNMLPMMLGGASGGGANGGIGGGIVVLAAPTITLGGGGINCSGQPATGAASGGGGGGGIFLLTQAPSVATLSGQFTAPITPGDTFNVSGGAGTGGGTGGNGIRMIYTMP